MQRSLFYVLACNVKHNVSLTGKHGQMEEPEQNSQFNHCILFLAMGFLAYTSLHSGSQSVVPGVISAFHMFCKLMRAGFYQFFCKCVCDFFGFLNQLFVILQESLLKCVSNMCISEFAAERSLSSVIKKYISKIWFHSKCFTIRLFSLILNFLFFLQFAGLLCSPGRPGFIYFKANTSYCDLFTAFGRVFLIINSSLS